MSHNIDTTALTEAIGPISKYAEDCHAAALAVVRSGLLPEGSRVAGKGNHHGHVQRRAPECTHSDRHCGHGDGRKPQQPVLVATRETA